MSDKSMLFAGQIVRDWRRVPNIVVNRDDYR